MLKPLLCMIWHRKKKRFIARIVRFRPQTVKVSCLLKAWVCLVMQAVGPCEESGFLGGIFVE